MPERPAYQQLRQIDSRKNPIGAFQIRLPAASWVFVLTPTQIVGIDESQTCV
jgi:hypothetical protein